MDYMEKYADKIKPQIRVFEAGGDIPKPGGASAPAAPTGGGAPPLPGGEPGGAPGGQAPPPAMPPAGGPNGGQMMALGQQYAVTRDPQLAVQIADLYVMENGLDGGAAAGGAPPAAGGAAPGAGAPQMPGGPGAAPAPAGGEMPQGFRNGGAIGRRGKLRVF